MILRWLRRLFERKRPDFIDYFEEIGPFQPSGSYTKRDRMRDYKAVFLSTPQGRRVLNDIVAQGRVFKSTHTRGDDSHAAFREGWRNFALFILDHTTGPVPEADPPRQARSTQAKEN